MQSKKQETESTDEHWTLFPAGGVKGTTQDAKVRFQVHGSICRCRCKSLQKLFARNFFFNNVLLLLFKNYYLKSNIF